MFTSVLYFNSKYVKCLITLIKAIYVVDVDSDESENEYPVENPNTDSQNKCTGNSIPNIEENNATSPEKNKSGENNVFLILGIINMDLQSLSPNQVTE